MVEQEYRRRAEALVNQARRGERTPEQRCDDAVELASCMLPWANSLLKSDEARLQRHLAGMMEAANGKVFAASVTDQCFRSDDPARVADQLSYLLRRYGVPSFLSWYERAGLSLFQWLAWRFPKVFVPMARKMLRHEAARVILPGEERALKKYLEHRKTQGVRVNLNHLGEAILGEDEALRRLDVYLHDLAKPEVEYISVKISTIYSQLNLLSYDETLEVLAERMRQLYRVAGQHTYTRPDGSEVQKFVNLDMEEYHDLHLTVDVFKKVLDEPEFRDHSAGIVLQAYLPDSYDAQVSLTEWAIKRVAEGGAQIKIRLVKGANLAMEQVHSSLHRWEQAPYSRKVYSDANFKKMLQYGCEPVRTRAVRLGVGSHNIFDIAYALLLSVEKGVGDSVTFEMLEGMADHLRRVVHQLKGDILLYCPAASEHEFHTAIAYLIRRLDENTGPKHFLRDSFSLELGSDVWKEQEAYFRDACAEMYTVSSTPRRVQDRRGAPQHLEAVEPFDNEPETDWALQENRKWIQNLVDETSWQEVRDVPLVVAGNEISDGASWRVVHDPSDPKTPRYRYLLATPEQAEEVLQCAEASKSSWGQTSVDARADLLARAARSLRERRDAVMKAMIFTCAKTAVDADTEYAEAIDFVEYYWRNLVELESVHDVRWTAKGTVLVAPPWNFPAAIPVGGVCAALAAGNTVIFKPAPEAVMVGWEVVQAFWDAGISREVLQFVNGEDETVGTQLIKDSRVDAVVLTGASETARHFLKMRPSMDLMAETGGKNSLIVTKMADRDVAAHNAIQSAFGHAGQKCSACSLLICEGEVYDDPIFRRQLVDAAKSLAVGPSWDLRTRVNPLIRAPGPELQRGLTQLDEGEEWLLKPEVDPSNSNLWSPGIKIGVKPGSFSHRTEFFGPVLSVMRAKSLEQAIRIANGTPYGLTAGLSSLDSRERKYWREHIDAGNCYINRGITGAVVRRQPFGGCKDSSFGPGSKAGGPNYLMYLMHPEQRGMPDDQDHPFDWVLSWHPQNLSDEDIVVWHASLGSYCYHWNRYFSHKHDPSGILGEENFLEYLPRSVSLRVSKQDSPLDVGRVCAAAAICGAPLEVTGEKAALKHVFGDRLLCPYPSVYVRVESDTEFFQRLKEVAWPHVRLLSKPNDETFTAYAEQAVRLLRAPVLANGRYELIHYLRQRSLSFSYHRYGNMGDREPHTG